MESGTRIFDFGTQITNLLAQYIIDLGPHFLGMDAQVMDCERPHHGIGHPPTLLDHYVTWYFINFKLSVRSCIQNRCDIREGLFWTCWKGPLTSHDKFHPACVFYDSSYRYFARAFQIWNFPQKSVTSCVNRWFSRDLCDFHICVGNNICNLWFIQEIADLYMKS